MRTLALVLPIVLVGCISSSNRELETHLAITDSHLDRLAQSLDALNAKLAAASAPAQRAPAVAGITCRDAKLTEYAEGGLKPGEKPLGAVQKCPAPRDFAQCLDGQPLSDVAAACNAGKLDALLGAGKDGKKS